MDNKKIQELLQELRSSEDLNQEEVQELQELQELIELKEKKSRLLQKLVVRRNGSRNFRFNFIIDKDLFDKFREKLNESRVRPAASAWMRDVISRYVYNDDCPHCSPRFPEIL